MSNEKRQLISKHIEGWKGSLQNASIEYFAEQGKVSGSLLCALEKMMQEYSDQQTALLQSRIKELEDGISKIMNWYQDENDSNPHSTDEWQAAYNNLFSLMHKGGNPNTPFYCNAAANDVGGCKEQCQYCKDFK